MRSLLITFLEEISPLGLFQISNYLKNNGHDVTTIFVPLNPKEEVFGIEENTIISEQEILEIFKLVSRIRPQLIGISLFTLHYYSAVKLTQKIKEAFPETLVIWGGIHPTIAPEECIQHVDMLCRGEGEAAMLELAQRIEKGQSIENIGSLWVKTGDGVIRNEIRPLIDDLDSIGFPRFDWKNEYVLHKGKMHLLDKDLYRKCVPRNGRIYDILTTRGCPYACSYCCNSLFRELYAGKGKIVRHRSVNSVIEEMVYAKNEFEFVDMMNFQDDVFITRTKDGWIQKLLEEYKEKIGYPFACKGSAREVTEENMSMLRNAGLEYFHIGIQGSERVNKNIYKRNTSSREQVIRASEILNKYRIIGRYDIILDDPFANEEDMLEVLDTLTRIKKPYLVGCFSMTFFPNSPIYKMAKEANLLTDAKDGYSLKMAQAKRTPLNNLVELTPRLPTFLVRFFIKYRNNRGVEAFLVNFFDFYYNFVFKSMYALSKHSKLLSFVKNMRFSFSSARRGNAS